MKTKRKCQKFVKNVYKTNVPPANKQKLRSIQLTLERQSQIRNGSATQFKYYISNTLNHTEYKNWFNKFFPITEIKQKCKNQLNKEKNCRKNESKDRKKQRN